MRHDRRDQRVRLLVEQDQHHRQECQRDKRLQVPMDCCKQQRTPGEGKHGEAPILYHRV